MKANNLFTSLNVYNYLKVSDKTVFSSAYPYFLNCVSLELGNFKWNKLIVVVLFTTKFSMSTFPTCIEVASI